MKGVFLDAQEIGLDSRQVIPEKQRKAMLRELAKTTSGAEFTCNSGSMTPTIVVGEKVRIKAVAIAALQVGDVVVYEGRDGYMLHRIVWISPRRRWFLHIGDAEPWGGPRRGLTSAIVGRSEHRRRRPRRRALLLALPQMMVRRGLRYLK